jgi:hypothetical protein
MSLTAQIAKHIHDVHLGGNWTDVSLKDSLAGLTWQQATAKPGPFNSIAALVYHMNYFICAVLKVLEGGPLEAHDKFSFDMPAINSQQDWDSLLEKTWKEAEVFAALVEQLPNSKLVKPLSRRNTGINTGTCRALWSICIITLGRSY